MSPFSLSSFCLRKNFHLRFFLLDFSWIILYNLCIIKAVGPDFIPVKVWKCLGELGVDWLTQLFNVIFRIAKIRREWRTSTVILLYKDKSGVQDCNNYRGIKLLSHTMKLWERIIEGRLRNEISISEHQFGFMLGRSTTEAIHLIRRLMEVY